MGDGDEDRDRDREEDLHLSKTNERKLTSQLGVQTIAAEQCKGESKILRSQIIEWQSKCNELSAKLILANDQKSDLRASYDDLIIQCTGALVSRDSTTWVHTKRYCRAQEVVCRCN